MLCIAALLPPCAQLAAADDLESAQASARKWIDLRLETSRVESDWSWQKGLLESMRESLKFQVKQLEETQALLSAELASGSAKVDQTREQVAGLQDELATLENNNREVIAKLQSMRPMFPPRLADSLELAYTSLSDATISTGERMQLVGTIINRCMQFNNRITYSEEILQPDAGKSEQVFAVLYWGLSHAYALNKETSECYLGRPANGGWYWIPQPDIGSRVNQLIDVFNEDTDPELVRVPVQINRKGAR